MIVRKINAVVGLLTTLLLFDHSIFHAVWMLGRGAVEKSVDIMPWLLMGLMALHAVLSMGIVMLSRGDGNGPVGNAYTKSNVSTIIQKVSGMLLIVLTALHVASAAGPLVLPAVVGAIVTPLFYAVALVHVGFSVSKALITLGVGNVKVIKIVDIAAKAIFASILVFDIVSFYIYIA